MPQYTISLERSDAIRLSGYSVLLVFLAASIFFALIGSENVAGGHALLMLLTYVAMLAVHELVHGVFFWVFGGKPKFGVGRVFVLPYAYASTPGTSYTLPRMLIILLSPLVLISIAALLVAASVPTVASYMVVAFVGNFAGAVGDMWIVSRLLPFRGSQNLRIVDEITGVSVHGEGRAFEQAAAALSAARDNVVSRFMVTWMTASFVVALLTANLTILLVATQGPADVLVGPRSFPLLEYSSSPTGVVVGFSLVPSVVAGFLFAAIYVGLRHARNRPPPTRVDHDEVERS